MVTLPTCHARQISVAKSENAAFARPRYTLVDDIVDNIVDNIGDDVVNIHLLDLDILLLS